MGGVILLGLVLAYRLIPWVQSLEVPREEVELKVKKLEKYMQLVQEGKGLEKEYSRLKREMSRLEAGLLPGKTSALAAVHVQNVLKEITDRNEVEIKSIRVLKPQPIKGAPYIKIPVEFRMHSDIAELKEVLYEIQRSSKYLKVTRLRIMAYSRKKGKKISSTLTVEGIMKKG